MFSIKKWSINAMVFSLIFLIASCEKDAPITSSCSCREREYRYNASNDSLAIANAFTPNNDGTNDFFRINRNFNLSVKDFRFQVLQNDKDVVFETSSPAESWTGRNAKNEDLPEGSYTVSISFVGDDNIPKSNCLCVQLLRPLAGVGCVDTFNNNYIFPDQYSPATNDFTYPTNERVCN